MRSNNFTKQVLLILLMIIGGSLKAQNDSTYIYQSFFGNDSTRINIYDLHICDGAETYIVQMSKNDTVNINGNLYYNLEEIKNATEFPKNETRLCDWCNYKNYCLKGETYDLIG